MAIGRRSAADQPLAKKLLHDTLAGPVAERVAAQFGVDDAVLSVELVASPSVGPAFARYQLRIRHRPEVDGELSERGLNRARYAADPPHF